VNKRKEKKICFLFLASFIFFFFPSFFHEKWEKCKKKQKKNGISIFIKWKIRGSNYAHYNFVMKNTLMN